ncbi:MAG: hypothetical protein ACRDWE_00865 [Acidimicrobiales bacterium]
MPKGRKRANTESISPDNDGWQLSNMSNRMSSVKRSARRARTTLDDPESWRTWSAMGLVRLVELTVELERRALEADRLWQTLRVTANGSDPGLVEPADGISMVHDHGDDPLTMARFGAAWDAGRDRIWQGYTAEEDLDRLILAETGGVDAGGLARTRAGSEG